MVFANNSIDNTVGASISGVTNTFTVTNPSNTASSAARSTIVVGGGTSGDPTLNFNVSGVTNWEVGIDNSDSDKLKISQGTALGTNDTLIITTSGEITLPLQPAFLALAPTVANATGNGTPYQLGTAAMTEIFDKGGDFNTNGTFTAPVTGIYSFCASAYLEGNVINIAIQIRTVTSNRTFSSVASSNPTNQARAVTSSLYCDMDVADTCVFTVTGGGEGGVTETILGSAGGVEFTYVSGTLVN